MTQLRTWRAGMRLMRARRLLDSRRRQRPTIPCVPTMMEESAIRLQCCVMSVDV